MVGSRSADASAENILGWKSAVRRSTEISAKKADNTSAEEQSAELQTASHKKLSKICWNIFFLNLEKSLSQKNDLKK